MRWIQLIILTAGMGLMVAPMMPYVQYVLFQEQIEAFHCENKDRPELNCEGTCFLAKQIKVQFEAQLDEAREDLPLTPPHPEEVKSGPYWFEIAAFAVELDLLTIYSHADFLLLHKHQLTAPPTPPPEVFS